MDASEISKSSNYEGSISDSLTREAPSMAVRSMEKSIPGSVIPTGNVREPPYRMGTEHSRVVLMLSGLIYFLIMSVSEVLHSVLSRNEIHGSHGEHLITSRIRILSVHLSIHISACNLHSDSPGGNDEHSKMKIQPFLSPPLLASLITSL